MKVTKDTFLLMRKAVVNLSNFNGQNYVKCQCQAVWCLCLKKRLNILTSATKQVGHSYDNYNYLFIFSNFILFLSKSTLQ